MGRQPRTLWAVNGDFNDNLDGQQYSKPLRKIRDPVASPNESPSREQMNLSHLLHEWCA